MGQLGRPRRVVSPFTTCTQCKKSYPTTEEHFRWYKGRTYPHSWCRNCEGEYGRNYWYTENGRKTSLQWRKDNRVKCRGYEKSQRVRDPERFASYDLKKRIGITLDQKKQKLQDQGNCCAICKSPTPDIKKQWFADHDHKTMRFRGVLCGSCNAVLGYAKDRPAVLFQAALYLLQFSENCGIMVTDKVDETRQEETQE